MNQICQNCENLSQIKYILLDQDRIRLICQNDRNQLVQYAHLESVFKEGNYIHMLPDFQKKISDFHKELQASINEYLHNFANIKLRLEQKLKKFDDLRKDIFDLNQLYKMEQTKSWEIEQQINRVLTQFQFFFHLDRQKAFSLMTKKEPFDDSIHLKLKTLLIHSL